MALKPTLVILGAGYLGEAVGKEGLRRGVRVVAVTRNAETATRLRSMGMETVIADLAEAGWAEQIDPRVDWVVNCVSPGGATAADYRRSHVEGGQRILDWRRRAGREVGSYVYTSSTSVYAQGEGAWVTEESVTSGETEQVRSLLAAEALALGSLGRGVVLRLAGLYGPGRHHLLDALRRGEAELPGRGDVRLNLIHREDACTAIWAALTAGGPDSESPDSMPMANIFNVADDGPAPKAEVVRWLAARVGAAMPVFNPQMPAVRRRQTPDRIIANTRIRRELGWSPQFPTYREGYAALLGA